MRLPATGIYFWDVDLENHRKSAKRGANMKYSLLAVSLTLTIFFFMGINSFVLADESDLITINWQDPPANILPESELDGIRQLDRIWRVRFETRVNPGGNTAALRAVHPDEEPLEGFWNFVSHEFVPSDLLDLPVRAASWASDDYLVSILEEQDESLFMAGTNKNTGRTFIEKDPLPVTGDVLALSPDASKLLILAPYTPEQLMLILSPDSRKRVKQRAEISERESSKVKTIKIPTKMASYDEHDDLEITAEDSVLLLVDLNNMEVHELTVFEAASVIPTASFSPDGKNLAVVHNYMGEEIESVVRKDSSVESLTQVQVQEALGRVAPEDNPLHTNSSLLFFDILPPENLPPRTLEARDVPGFYPKFPDYFKPVWSPSGDQVMLMAVHPTTLEGREMPVYFETESSSYLVLDTDLEVSQVINTAPFSYPGQVARAGWLSSHEMVFTLIDGMDHAVYKYDLNNGTQSKLYKNGVINSSLLLPDQRSMYIMVQSGAKAPELWILNLDSGEAIQVTEMNKKISLDAGVAAHPVEFTLESGKVLLAYWFSPEDMPWPPRNERVVFWQAGGPGGSMLNRWSSSVETPLTLLPSMGMSVLMLPLQERPGWDSANWKELADGQNFGKVDIDQLAEIAMQLKDRGWVSDRGAGITGCSYGGYMTSQSIVRYPDLWDAAVTQCSLLDLHTEFQMGYAAHIAYLMGNVPWMARDHYYQASPGFHGNKVKTPTLVFHGVDDFLPVGIAQNFFYDIHFAGTPARMLRFLDEEHGLYHDANQFYAAQEQIKWFRDYLQ